MRSVKCGFLWNRPSTLSPPMHGTWRALAAWNQAELWLTGLVRGTKVLVLVDSSAKRQVESN